MADRRTTRCCSAVALIAVSTIAVAAQPRFLFKHADEHPLALTPTRTAWTLALNARLVQAPAFDEVNAYFALEQGRIAAYQLVPGTLKWIVNAQPATAMVAGDGLLFFARDDQLVALSASNGSIAWTKAFSGHLGVAPVWANGWLIVAAQDGKVAAFRARDGQGIWQQDIGSAPHAPPAISGDHVYVPADDDVVIALEVETGAPVWQRRLGGMPNEILALDDRIFVGSTDHYMYCLDTADGRVDWRTRAGSEIRGLPAVDERRVYFVSLDNVLRAVNRSHGVQQWIQMLKFRPLGGPVKAGDTIVVSGLQPPLRAFNIEDGKAASDIDVNGLIAAPVHLTEAVGPPPGLVVVTRDIAAGDSVMLVVRAIDPPITPYAAFGNPLESVPRLSPGS